MTKKPLRVLFILPSLIRAGAETQLVSLVNGLDPQQFEKHLLVFERALDLWDRIDHAHVTAHHSLRRFKFDLQPAQEIIRLINEHNIEVVHCTLEMALLFGWIGVRFSKPKPPLVVAIHSTINPTRKDEFANHLYSQLMRNCSKIIFVCKNQEKHWLSRFHFLKDKTTVIYNGIDAKLFDLDSASEAGQRLKRELNIPRESFIISCIAEFRPAKGHKILIEAFAQVVKNNPKIFLLLAGNGLLRYETEQMVRARKLCTNVRFLGAVDDVRPVLAASHCSVLASTATETFSIAMLESFAMRVPMIATDTGGMREAIQDGKTGYLVKPGDVGEMVEAIDKMLRAPQAVADMGANARALAETRFTIKNMLDQTTLILLAAGRRVV